MNKFNDIPDFDYHFPDITNMIAQLFTPGRDISLQQDMILKLFTTILEEVSRWEDRLWEDVTDEGNLTLDLEHIVAVGSDKVDMGSLPEEYRNLSDEEYLIKLKEVIKKRREDKDLATIYRTVKQRCANIVNFINGMGNRKYEIRYKNPALGVSAGVSKELAPVSRELDTPGVISTQVHVTRKPSQPLDDDSAAYASRNYPH